jgi:hypothetical protein
MVASIGRDNRVQVLLDVDSYPAAICESKLSMERQHSSSVNSVCEQA